MPAVATFFSSISVGAKFVILVPVIIIVWTLLVGGPVTELPFGTQTAVNTFAYTVHQLVTVLPMLEVVYDLFIAVIQIKLMLIAVQTIKWVLSIYLA